MCDSLTVKPEVSRYDCDSLRAFVDAELMSDDKYGK